MTEERRQHPRQAPKTVKIRYDDPEAGMIRREARVHDLSFGGMFVETASPLEEGYRSPIEIDFDGVTIVLEALVVRVRRAPEGPNRPVGMALRFVELKTEVASTLRLALMKTSPHDQTVLGVGGAAVQMTIAGVAPAPATASPASPAVEDARARDRTILGVGGASATATTPGIPAPTPSPGAPAGPPLEQIEPESEPRVAARPAPMPAPPAAALPPPTVPRQRTTEDSGQSSLATPLPRRRSGVRWIAALLVLGAGGVAAYAFRDVLRSAYERTVRPEPTLPSVPSAPAASAIDAEPATEAGPTDAAQDAPNDARTDDAATDAPAASSKRYAGATDAGRDAGRDGGRQDGGAHDAGAHDAGPHRDGGARDAGRPHDGGTKK